MAGEWLKMEACTPEKSEVLAITARMGWDDADLTVGKLFRLWRWFDQQTTDGNACGVTAALLDRVVGVTGFCNAVQSVGWLTITESGISLPNFERHNGNTAKNRALTAKRVANHKANAKGNAVGNADTVTNALPREEKRRKDKEPKGSLPPYPQGLDVEAWDRWVGYRKQIGKSLKPASIQSAQQALAQHGTNQAAVVDQSIANGWQGLFHLKANAATQSAQPNRQEALEARNRAAVEAALAQVAHA